MVARKVITRTLLLTVALVLAASVGWLGLLTRDRTVPVANAVIRVLNTKPIYPGDEVQIDLSITYLRDCSARVVRRVFDSKGEPHQLPVAGLDDIQKGPSHFTSFFSLPSNFPAGQARYESKPYYSCNVIQWLFPVKAKPRNVVFQVNALANAPEEPGGTSVIIDPAMTEQRLGGP